MPIALALLLAFALWGGVAWIAWPREIWDAPVFGRAWGAATILAGGLGYLFARMPALAPALVFSPLAVVLVVSGLLTGSGFGLLPLGLALIAVLALPALGLSWLASRLSQRR